MHALYPISGNPPTWGHADVMERSAQIFERVTWALAANPNKTYDCPLPVRLEMMEDYIRHLGLKNVTVAQYQGATVRFAESIDAGVIIKGLRNPSDLQTEMEQFFGNRGMNEDIETMLLFTRPGYGLISSSLIRELAYLGESIDDYVLPSVAEKFKAHMNR